MYSAVLMLALTAGSETVDFGRNRCHGSTSGCTTTVAARSSCSSSCSSRGGLFANRGHGCSTSRTTTRVVSSCATSSSCARSHGGLFSRMGNRGCNTSRTCATTCSTVVVEKKKEMPKGEKVDPPKPDDTKKKVPVPVAAPATIVVSLPADARLIVDGNITTSTSDRRTLVTPNLEFGSDYVYTMVAEIVRDGRTMEQSQQVTVRGGQIANVQFTFTTQTSSSR